VTEGLAQYYTWAFLDKIKSDQPNVMAVFERLLAMQHDDYHTHKIWMEGAPEGQSEAIRPALLDARLQGIVNKHDFAADAAANKHRLGRPQQ
jgi:hypothetical protein